MTLDATLLDARQIASMARHGMAERSARNLAGAANAEEVRRVAEEFEAVFLNTMLAPMFEELEPDPVFGGGPGEDAYRAMLVEEYSKSIARAGGIGIAESVERELLRLQEAAQP